MEVVTENDTLTPSRAQWITNTELLITYTFLQLFYSYRRDPSDTQSSVCCNIICEELPCWFIKKVSQSIIKLGFTRTSSAAEIQKSTFSITCDSYYVSTWGSLYWFLSEAHNHFMKYIIYWCQLLFMIILPCIKLKHQEECTIFKRALQMCYTMSNMSKVKNAILLKDTPKIWELAI